MPQRESITEIQSVSPVARIARKSHRHHYTYHWAVIHNIGAVLELICANFDSILNMCWNNFAQILLQLILFLAVSGNNNDICEKRSYLLNDNFFLIDKNDAHV